MKQQPFRRKGGCRGEFADPCVPDIGTEKAARLATALTGNPGCRVRLDCGHPRHVQRPCRQGRCWTAPPARHRWMADWPAAGSWACRQGTTPAPGLPPIPTPPSRHASWSPRPVTATGLNTVLADVEQLVEELVANAARRTEAPLELTIDAHDDVVGSRFTTRRPGSPWGWRSTLGATARLHRPQPTASIGGAPCRRGARPGPLGGTP